MIKNPVLPMHPHMEPGDDNAAEKKERYEKN
jgi:hypothetical protein